MMTLLNLMNVKKLLAKERILLISLISMKRVY
jgi:hypothetical protein